MPDAKILENGISALKSEFASSYTNGAHIYELIPESGSFFCGIPEKDLRILHEFAESNPIYGNSYGGTFAGTPCTVYEGDMSSYWLDSIKHDASYAPFYPTWILSAYALAQAVANIGIKHIADVGSGDGRIAYCAQAAGMDSLSIEIDENLAALQEKICRKTGVHFEIKCKDAVQADYSAFAGKSAAFFIGGLPEIGEMLARGVIKRTIQDMSSQKTAYVLAGTLAPRKTGRDSHMYGWGTLMEEFGLEEIMTIVLPTRWTLEQPKDTPYMFVSPKNQI